MIKWAFSIESPAWVNALAIVTSVVCGMCLFSVFVTLLVSRNYAAIVAIVAVMMIIAWGIAYREYKRSRHYAQDRGGEGRGREDTR